MRNGRSWSWTGISVRSSAIIYLLIFSFCICLFVPFTQWKCASPSPRAHYINCPPPPPPPLCIICAFKNQPSMHNEFDSPHLESSINLIARFGEMGGIRSKNMQSPFKKNAEEIRTQNLRTVTRTSLTLQIKTKRANRRRWNKARAKNRKGRRGHDTPRFFTSNQDGVAAAQPLMNAAACAAEHT